MTTTTEQEIAYYVERVRAALADLPPALRDELLEDLPEHLAEVAAEADGPLAERLGAPEAYAADLRAAAAVGQPTRAPNLDQRIGAAVVAVRARLRAVDTRLGPVIGYARLSQFVRLLRPAWWLLRGYLVAMIVTVTLTGDSFGLLPRLGGSTLAAVLLLTATVLGSIWLGRRSDGFTRWPKAMVNVGAAVIVLFGFYAFVDADGYARNQRYYTPSSNLEPYANIQDVYVYDEQGRLIENARLFDQNGQPIQLGYAWCPEALQDLTGRPVQTYPYCPSGAPFQFSVPETTASAPTLTFPPGAVPSATPAPSVTPAPRSPSPSTPVEQPPTTGP